MLIRNPHRLISTKMRLVMVYSFPLQGPAHFRRIPVERTFLADNRIIDSPLTAHMFTTLGASGKAIVRVYTDAPTPENAARQMCHVYDVHFLQPCDPATPANASASLPRTDPIPPNTSIPNANPSLPRPDSPRDSPLIRSGYGTGRWT